MAHFAQLDENNVVTQVIVVSNDDTSDANGVEVEEIGVAFCKKLLGADTKWKQTSYNNNFRVRYAGIGYTYNETLNAFVPPKPFDSWVLNETTINWDSPIPRPELTQEQVEQGYYYEWEETTLTWRLKSISNYLNSKPHPSWNFNFESGQWESPIGPAPTLNETDSRFGCYYQWDEENGEWDLILPEGYNPNATDGDGDGIIQDGTKFERPIN
jgi:hypothetical protein